MEMISNIPSSYSFLSSFFSFFSILFLRWSLIWCILCSESTTNMIFMVEKMQVVFKFCFFLVLFLFIFFFITVRN